MKIIALDIGSSFTKSAIMDTASGALLSKTRMPTPARLDTDDPTRFEVDADLIYDTAVSYTHLDVYKRQRAAEIPFPARHRDQRAAPQ